MPDGVTCATLLTNGRTPFEWLVALYVSASAQDPLFPGVRRVVLTEEFILDCLNNPTVKVS